jgi:hypothetical protein
MPAAVIAISVVLLVMVVVIVLQDLTEYEGSSRLGSIARHERRHCYSCGVHRVWRGPAHAAVPRAELLFVKRLSCAGGGDSVYQVRIQR